jgi:anti-sigma B factor antagonist/stage II sporulation protein AA (anti-sigma F factor antagonist)
MVMEEFQRQIANGFIIERVNLSQATIAEALRFKKHLEMDIELGYKTIVVDLSNCNSLDPAFIGVLVVTLKQLMRLGGSIKIVKPGMFSKSMLNLTGTIEKFELYESLDNAIASMTIREERIREFSNRGLDRLAIAQ